MEQVRNKAKTMKEVEEFRDTRFRQVSDKHDTKAFFALCKKEISEKEWVRVSDVEAALKHCVCVPRKQLRDKIEKAGKDCEGMLTGKINLDCILLKYQEILNEFLEGEEKPLWESANCPFLELYVDSELFCGIQKCNTCPMRFMYFRDSFVCKIKSEEKHP